ncbi:MAG: L-lactate dehydrogenase [Candidatus Pacebacteria bacterium CG10_big_fil_rev_8_21_14_0_10_42_12]|nr:L-lactate dehydrogenase [Candidatus Paceibacterota bacterium]PIR62158.1 MAG: L-lactate dehydrogenase [Candidatus Pacebacteria bacterium CG10_big_fil_rev_8_21_14_0_10_42_12]
MIFDTNKVSIIGCGKVGMSAAYSLLHQGVVNELVLFGRDKNQLLGEELDLEHALSFLPSATIKATDSYADLENSDVVVITAGAAQKPGETRLDLTKKNLSIIESIIPNVVKYAPNSIILIVSNPVDILTYRAYQIAGWPKGRIFGSGTTLDTSRFRFHLSEFLKVSPRSIHAYILGEHGDSSFPVISSAMVGGQSITTLDSFSEEKALKAYEKAKEAAYKIIACKGSTFFGIGAVISHIVGKILRDAKSVLPVSIPLHQYYGHSGMAVSVPCVIGRAGVEKVLEAKLDWKEKQELAKSVETLKSYL